MSRLPDARPGDQGSFLGRSREFLWQFSWLHIDFVPGVLCVEVKRTRREDDHLSHLVPRARAL
jgi:hypothetical protein